MCWSVIVQRAKHQKAHGSYPGIILVRLINTSFTFPPYPDTYVIFFQVIMRLFFFFFTTYATHVLLTKISLFTCVGVQFSYHLFIKLF